MLSFFLCLLKLYFRIFLYCFCILYTSVYQWNTATWWILNNCRECAKKKKCCFTNFLLSSSELPKSLFSCVIFSKVPILRSKCTYRWREMTETYVHFSAYLNGLCFPCIKYYCIAFYLNFIEPYNVPIRWSTQWTITYHNVYSFMLTVCFLVSILGIVFVRFLHRSWKY